MPQVCFERPNRSSRRVWNAKRVGQVACYAIRDGATLAEIEAEIAKCGRPEERRKSAEAQAALEAAAEALEASNSELTLDSDVLRRFLSTTAPLLPLLRFGARFLTRKMGVVGAGIVAIRQVATARLAQITARTAANDSTIAIVRRAAANEARFLRSGTR